MTVQALVLSPSWDEQISASANSRIASEGTSVLSRFRAIVFDMYKLLISAVLVGLAACGSQVEIEVASGTAAVSAPSTSVETAAPAAVATPVAPEALANALPMAPVPGDGACCSGCDASKKKAAMAAAAASQPVVADVASTGGKKSDGACCSGCEATKAMALPATKPEGACCSSGQAANQCCSAGKAAPAVTPAPAN